MLAWLGGALYSAGDEAVVGVQRSSFSCPVVQLRGNVAYLGQHNPKTLGDC